MMHQDVTLPVRLRLTEQGTATRDGATGLSSWSNRCARQVQFDH